MKTIFILDDIRNIRMAENNIPYPFTHYDEDFVYSICRNASDAFQIIKNSAPFDLWIFDYDLGEESLDGYEFLKKILMEMPEKAPNYLRCCSDNSYGRDNILQYWENWLKHNKEDK